MSSFDEEVDVVVAGSGCAGCAAAISAMHHGAREVVVAEKSPKLIGGTTKLAGGGWLWCPGNPYLLELGVKYDPNAVFELLKDLATGNDYDRDLDSNDVALMRTFAFEWPTIVKEIIQNKYMDLALVEVRTEEDAAALKKLILEKAAAHEGGADAFFAQTGISPNTNLDALAKLMPSYCGAHALDDCPTGKVLAPDGSTTSKQLEKSAKKLGVQFRMGTAVTELVWDEAGEVIGCVLTNGDISTRVKTRNGVIFGSGGFSHNTELMQKHYGVAGAPVGTCSCKTNTGDLITILNKAKRRIPTVGMDQAWVKQTVLPHDFPSRIGVFFLNGDSFMVVDSTGRRYANEKDFYQERGSQMRAHPSRKVVFHIHDERSGELFEGPIKGLGGPFPWSAIEDVDYASGASAADLAAGIESYCATHGIESGIDDVNEFAANLDAQIDRFNAMCEDGVDYEFKRGENATQYAWSVPRAVDNKLPNKTMFPLNKQKLRCVVLGLATLDTKGGPKIDTSGRLLDVTNNVVPGLYGCGNAVKSATNHSYPASGATMSNAVLFGWKAGRAAVYDSKLSAL